MVPGFSPSSGHTVYWSGPGRFDPGFVGIGWSLRAYPMSIFYFGVKFTTPLIQSSAYLSSSASHFSIQLIFALRLLTRSEFHCFPVAYRDFCFIAICASSVSHAPRTTVCGDLRLLTWIGCCYLPVAYRACRLPTHCAFILDASFVAPCAFVH